VITERHCRAGMGDRLTRAGPLLCPGVELAKNPSLCLPPRQERLITSGNAIRLLRRAAGATAGESRACLTAVHPHLSKEQP
jgi:hypothetical protein